MGRGKSERKKANGKREREKKKKKKLDAFLLPKGTASFLHLTFTLVF